MTGVPLFRVFGIQVSANWSWGIVLFLITASLAGGYLPDAVPDRSTAFYWSVGFLSALLFFLSLLAHELAHSLVARAAGLPVREILLFIFGGVSNIEREAHEPGVEFRIAVVGPLTSFAIGAVCWLLAAMLDRGATWAVVTYLAVVNVAVGVFNLIPGFPLDGGRVLRAFLWHRWRDLGRATRAAANVGNGVGWALIALGVLQALAGSLVGGVWMALIGMFLRGASEASVQQVALREHLGGVTVADVMTPRDRVVSVEADLPVSRFVDDYLWHERFDMFPVIGHSGEFVGIVGLEQIRGIDRAEWRSRRVSDVMRPAADVPRLGPDEQAVKALQAMLQSGEGRLPVLGQRRQDGRPALAGVVTRRDILHLLRLRTDLGEPGARRGGTGAGRPAERPRARA